MAGPLPSPPRARLASNRSMRVKKQTNCACSRDQVTGDLKAAIVRQVKEKIVEWAWYVLMRGGRREGTDERGEVAEHKRN